MQIKNTVLATAVLACQLAAATTGTLGDAQEVTNNPTGKTYVANFGNARSDVVTGTISFSSSNGEGVEVSVSLGGFDVPEGSGPFSYHIHDKAVPSDGNCTATGGHLDPYERGQKPACDSAAPETCEVGDLAGKHGKIPEITGWSNYTTTTYPVVLSYTDAYISINSSDASFIGNRSIVIHNANTTRIACVNILESTNSSSSNSSIGTSGVTVVSTDAAPGLTIASKVAMGVAGLAAFAFAL